jgi:UDP:flavonoid glycosyltransferase YjiC (YdhE family)
MDLEKTIYILTCPYTGHCNPLLPICYGLTSQNNYLKIIVYGDEKFKKLFESTGAIFRPYKSSALYENMNDNMNFSDMLVWGTTVADKNVRHLYDEIRKELPDLVLYDKSPLYPKLMIEYFVQEMRRENLKMFKIVRYDTAINMDHDYPNKFEQKLMELNLSWTFFTNIFVYLYQKRSYMIKVN